MSTPYFVGVNEGELKRLEQQHLAWRKETGELWDAAGFGKGQTIADMGCGPGYTSLDLARRVGPEGRISAIDKAAYFLRHLESVANREAIHNIECQTVDLVELAAMEMEGSWDGAFTRWLLAFLVDHLEGILGAVFTRLKPGGRLACFEYLTIDSLACSPPCPGFDAHTHAWNSYYTDHGGDTRIGSYLPTAMEEAGFVVESTDCVAQQAPSGSPKWKWWGRLIAEFGPVFADQGRMSRMEWEALQTHWMSHSTLRDAYIFTPVLARIVARKPIPVG